MALAILFILVLCAEWLMVARVLAIDVPYVPKHGRATRMHVCLDPFTIHGKLQYDRTLQGRLQMGSCAQDTLWRGL